MASMTGKKRGHAWFPRPAASRAKDRWIALTIATALLALTLLSGNELAASPDETEGQNGGQAPVAAIDFRSGVQVDSLIRPGEVHFKHLYQLTNGGENAEAYFSSDGTELIYQWTPRGGGCDQIYTLPAAGGAPRLVSTGKGRCTCAYFFPGDREILFASTHLAGEDCPPPPDHSQGYVWAVYESYDIFKANRDGTEMKRLTSTPGYDAEATIGPDGTIVFTSARDGDLDLYTMKPDGSDVRRLTHTPGYDGGAFFSADGKKICYRAHHPTEDEKLEEFRSLLKAGLIKPSQLEIFVMDADGKNGVQVTQNGAANFCPFFHPSGGRLIFASNQSDEKGRNFDLYLIGLEGKNQEQVTFESSFDGFPMFSPDGRRLVFASNRGAEERGETNIFMADWVE